MAASAKEVRRARAFLQGKKIGSKDIPPRLFANAARELNASFSELLEMISRVMLGGQAQGRIRMELLRKEVSK